MPRASGAIAIATAVLLVLLVGQPAQAAPVFHPSTKVVLFTPATSDPLVARLEAELAAVGIQVRKISMPPESQLDAAVSREIAGGASAAIRVIPRARGADVWTGETTARMLHRRGTDTSDAALSVIALRTVEFLRATLLDVKKKQPVAESPGREPAGRESGTNSSAAPTSATERPGPGAPAAGEPSARGTDVPAPARSGETAPARNAEATPRASVEPPAVARATEPPTTAVKPAGPPSKPERLPEWGLAPPPELAAPSEPLYLEVSAGPALIASPGGINPVTSVAAIGRGHFAGQAGLELMAVFPLSPSHVTKDQGSVAIKTAMFGGALVFHMRAPRHLRADAAVGASAIMLRIEGTGIGTVGPADMAVPNVGTFRSVWTMAGHVRVGGGVDLNRWLSLRADVIGGLMARTVVGYDVTTGAGKTTTTDWASWGPAFAAGTLGLQASW